MRIIAIPDVNSDGIDDCKILYSDGEEQFIYVTYAVEGARNSLCGDDIPKKHTSLSDSFAVIDDETQQKILFKVDYEMGQQLVSYYPELLAGQLNSALSTYRFALNANPESNNNPDALYATLKQPSDGITTIYPDIKSELRLLANTAGVLEEKGEFLIQGTATAANGMPVKATVLEIYPDYYLNDEYEDTGDLRLISIGDVNGDGIDDCKALYSDGEEQLLYVTYVVADSRTNVCKDTIPGKKSTKTK